MLFLAVKKSRFNNFLVITLLIIACAISADVKADSGSPVDDIKSLFGVNQDEARRLLRSVGVVIRSVQTGISTIADSDHAYRDKIGKHGLINGVINDSFSSERAKIYVSSLNRSNLNTYTVKDYLSHLANLSQNGKYHDVKIYFDKGMILSNIARKNKETEMNIDVFQLFKGCKRFEKIPKCYTDVTKKTFVVKIDHSFGDIGDARIYVDGLGVKDTMTLEDGAKLVDSFKSTLR